MRLCFAALLASGEPGQHDWEWIDPATGSVITSGTAAENTTATVFSDPGTQPDAVLIVTDNPVSGQ